MATGEAIPLRGLEGVPGLPGAPQDDEETDEAKMRLSNLLKDIQSISKGTIVI